MKETRNASRLALNGLSRIRFLCLAATLAMSGLVGSHAYSALPPRIQAPRKRRGMWLWVATDDTHSSKNSVALPEQRPHHHHHKKHHKGKKHDKLMARAIALNKELISCESSQDILSLLAQQPHALTKMAGGGALNSVNFSTALHRMARYSPQDRSQTLRDARFALFLCSLSEAMAGMDYTQSLLEWRNKPQRKKLSFNSRECSNIAWAIAKLRMAPPLSALPITLAENHNDLVETSLKLRSQVLESSRTPQDHSSSWIPSLSLLSGRLLDSISHMTYKSSKVFNTQEMANLLWALATAQRADPRVFNHISSSLVRGMGKNVLPKPQELSNSVWAFATAQIGGPGQASLIEYVADAMVDNAEFVREFKAQELSNTAWGVATILSSKSTTRNAQEDARVLDILRQVARAIAERADDFKPQELSNTVWAFATLGFGVGTGSASALNDYIYLVSQDTEGDGQLMSRALDAVAKSALPRLKMFRSQELNNLAWAFARLERTDSMELCAGIGRELSQMRRRVTGQDIGTTLWSFATLEYFDADLYRMIVSRLTIDGACNFNPQELSNSVWALATAGVEVTHPDSFDTTLVPQNLRPPDWRDDPVMICFASAASELMRRPHEFKAQEIKDVVWSFSKAGVRHPKLFKSMAEHLVGRESDAVPDGRLYCGRGLDEFSPQGIGNLAWSYAKQAQLAVETINRVEGLTSDTSGRLFIFSTICIDVGETLIKRLFNACAEADIVNHDGLAKLKPQDMSNTAWSFAVLGLRHTRFFEAVSRQVVKRLSIGAERGGSFKGQELANIVWACATLNNQFPDLLNAIAPYMRELCEQDNGTLSARSIAKHFKRQELANIAWSCAVMGWYPPDLMHILYMGLVGNGGERDTEYLSQLFGDGGLQRQAIMSLLYVQIAVEMEFPANDLTLPKGFPDAWDAVGDTGCTENPPETVSMLTLSTSRIQKDVSHALDRIGFSHVQEKVICMEELVRNHDIQLSPKPFEILSIDIADVKDKVGIEVDGPGHFCSVLDEWSPQEEARGYAKLVNGKLEYQFQWDGRQQMNGSTALKERLLQRLGWTVLHIPFWEWYAMSGDTAKEDAYCTKLLEERNYESFPEQ